MEPRTADAVEPHDHDFHKANDGSCSFRGCNIRQVESADAEPMTATGRDLLDYYGKRPGADQVRAFIIAIENEATADTERLLTRWSNLCDAAILALRECGAYLPDDVPVKANVIADVLQQLALEIDAEARAALAEGGRE